MYGVLSVQPVDIRNLDLDAAVDIEKGKIVLYPEAAPLPASAPAAADKNKSTARRLVRGSVAVSPPAAAAAGARRSRKSRSGAGEAGSLAPKGGISKAATAAPFAPIPKPACGAGLNVPALLTFRRMLVKSRDDAKAVAAFRAKLEAHAAKIGAVFVHYEAESGNWVMKVDGF